MLRNEPTMAHSTFSESTLTQKAIQQPPTQSAFKELDDMRLPQICQATMYLIGEAFLSRNQSEESASRQSMARILQLRTLILHAIIMIGRVVMVTMDIAHWRQAFDKDSAVASEIVIQLEIPLKSILTVLLVIGVFLNILCWRKLNITQILIYYELVYNTVLALVPYEYGDAASFTIFYWTLCVFLYASCSSSSIIDILSCTIFTAI